LRKCDVKKCCTGYETYGYCNLTKEAIHRCEVHFGALASEAICHGERFFVALASEAIRRCEVHFGALASEAIFLFDFLPSQGRIKERFPLKRSHTGVFFVVLTSEATSHGENFFVAITSEAIFLIHNYRRAIC
jgi:hypothetical protein